MSDISIKVLSATGEGICKVVIGTQHQKSIGGACKFLELMHGETGRLESSAGVGIERDDVLLLEAGAYVFNLTGMSRSPGDERVQLVAH